MSLTDPPSLCHDMSNCGIYGGKLGGRGNKTCSSCTSKHGIRRSSHSRHLNHKKNKRERKNTANAWLLHNAPTPPTAPPAPPTCCGKCSFVFTDIRYQLESAKRSNMEVDTCKSKGSTKVSKYNHARLKEHKSNVQ